jgi:hypothetical protein
VRERRTCEGWKPPAGWPADEGPADEPPPNAFMMSRMGEEPVGAVYAGVPGLIESADPGLASFPRFLSHATFFLFSRSGSSDARCPQPVVGWPRQDVRPERGKSAGADQDTGSVDAAVAR